MNWLKKLGEAKVSSGSNYFKAGRGTLILKDCKKIAGEDDPDTFIFEFVIKDVTPTSEADRNFSGQTVSYIQKLNSFKSAPGNTKSAALAVFKCQDPTADGWDEAKLKTEILDLFRIAKDGPMAGYTTPGVCAARGIELTYETRQQLTRDKSKELTLPTFYPKKTDKEAVLENRKTYLGE